MESKNRRMEEEPGKRRGEGREGGSEALDDE